jgi:hypothetical protein
MLATVIPHIGPLLALSHVCLRPTIGTIAYLHSHSLATQVVMSEPKILSVDDLPGSEAKFVLFNYEACTEDRLF